MKTLLPWFGLLLVGCVLPPAPATSTGQPVAAADAPAAGGLGCTQVFDCLGSCGVDEACMASCQAAGSPVAQPRVSALLDCSTSVCQNDADCVATSCRAQIDSCVADTAVASAGSAEAPAAPAAGPRQPHTTENLLPWMTGAWIGTNHQFTFHADGRVRRSSGVALYTEQGTYGCVSLVNDEGTVTQQGDLLIMTFDASEENHCGDKTAGPALTVRYRIEWYDNVYDDDPDLQLILRDLDCPPDQSMYCDDALRRR